MTINKIYFRRASKVLVENYDENSAFNFSEVASLDANLRKLGYALDGALAERLVNAPVDEIKRIHNDLISEAKEIKGVRRYSPMYPNFPRQVMEASEAELYINAIAHYFGTAIGVRIMPKYDKVARPDLNFDESKVTLVGLGDSRDFRALMGNLMNSKSAFSPTDRADLESLDNTEFLFIMDSVKTSELANRENKAFIANQSWVRYNRIDSPRFKFDTATDVLRLAVALSDGDVSLAEPTKFRSFKRAERRLLMALLAEVKGSRLEDMMRHQSAWKRLGERLHPGEFKQYPSVQEDFAIVRSNNGFESFNSRVEAALASEDGYGDPLGAARLLSHRPGEFARRLDKVLRTNAHRGLQQDIIHKFSKVAAQASPTVLLQARNNFVNERGGVRVFFPKGSVAKMQSVKDTRGVLDSRLRRDVVDVFDAALYENFAGRGDLGGSWIDPALQSIAIPFGQRNASKALKTLGRGSRLSLGDDSNVIRFFIWWHDAAPEAGTGLGYRAHTDIDLSAVCFGDDYSYHSAITFYNLRENGAVHSGDVTSAPNGASEFIDIDIDTLRKRGVRYVAMTLHSYSGQTLVDLPECFAGFMERRDLGSGEVYDPRTVTNKADLSANSRGATPFIFDLETREAIWVDLSMQVSNMAGTVASTKGQITSLVEAMTKLSPPNLYDLFSLHAAARGGIVSKNKAKTVFSFDGDVTPFDTEVILDEYL